MKKIVVKIPPVWKDLLSLTAEECAAREQPEKARATRDDDPKVYKHEWRSFSVDEASVFRICLTKYTIGPTKNLYTLEVMVGPVMSDWDIRTLPYEETFDTFEGAYRLRLE